MAVLPVETYPGAQVNSHVAPALMPLHALASTLLWTLVGEHGSPVVKFTHKKMSHTEKVIV